MISVGLQPEYVRKMDDGRQRREREQEGGSRNVECRQERFEFQRKEMKGLELSKVRAMEVKVLDE